MKDYLRKKLSSVLNRLGYTEQDIHFERPKDPKFGDLSTNIAMIISRKEKSNPFLKAEKIVKELKENIDDKHLREIRIEKPGFINFYISPNYFSNDANDILQKGDTYGKEIQSPEKLSKPQKTANVEWVSANPTGPLHAGHGRHIALGKAIANLLEWNGYKVTREYYYNNAGKQMENLAKSAYARYRQLFDSSFQLPEDSYAGEYIIEIANQIKQEYGNKLINPENDLYLFKEAGENWCFKSIKHTLDRLGINHDVFYNEDTLYKEGKIKEILQEFKSKDLSYEKGGAVWLKTSVLIKDKKNPEDKVIVKSTGEPTYRLPDMAYHIDKIKRGYDLVVDIFGADHADTYKEVLAGVNGLGYDTSNIKVILHQMVTFVKEGKPVKMSKRSDNVYYLDDLLDDVGVDVSQFFFVMRSANSHLDFDVALAKEQSEKNPVFYLQYAHARICGILRNAKEVFPDYKLGYLDEIQDFGKLIEPEEISLRKVLSLFPEIVSSAAETFEPHKVINYLNEAAENYHKFYHNHRVINPEDKELSYLRLKLCEATKVVLRNGFEIIGISAPERM